MWVLTQGVGGADCVSEPSSPTAVQGAWVSGGAGWLTCVAGHLSVHRVASPARPVLSYVQTGSRRQEEIQSLTSSRDQRDQAETVTEPLGGRDGWLGAREGT